MREKCQPMAGCVPTFVTIMYRTRLLFFIIVKIDRHIEQQGICNECSWDERKKALPFI